MARGKKKDKDLDAYLSASVGDRPAPGSKGVESDWFPLTEWSAPTGPLLACDPRQGLNEDDALLLPQLGAGKYVLTVKGLDLNGHRRLARLRIVRAGVNADALTLGDALGEVPVDHGIFAFVDYGEVERVLPKGHPDFERLADALTEELIGIGGGFYTALIGLEMGKHTGGGEPDDIDFVCVLCGLGDGGYPVFPLLDAKGKMQGAEAEFLPPGFVTDGDEENDG